MHRSFKSIVIIVALLVAAGCVLNATGAATVAPQGKKSGRKGAPAKIDSVYQQHCARCHGADGRGDTKLGQLYNTPNLTDAGLHARFSDKQLFAIITNGQSGMPAFKKTLSRAEIAALVTYARRFRK